MQCNTHPGHTAGAAGAEVACMTADSDVDSLAAVAAAAVSRVHMRVRESARTRDKRAQRKERERERRWCSPCTRDILVPEIVLAFELARASSPAVLSDFACLSFAWYVLTSRQSMQLHYTPMMRQTT
jgi:hypothetical protein